MQVWLRLKSSMLRQVKLPIWIQIRSGMFLILSYEAYSSWICLIHMIVHILWTLLDFSYEWNPGSSVFGKERASKRVTVFLVMQKKSKIWAFNRSCRPLQPWRLWWEKAVPASLPQTLLLLPNDFCWERKKGKVCFQVLGVLGSAGLLYIVHLCTFHTSRLR